MNRTKIHKYFKKGDVVCNEEIWGKHKFVIGGFGGNAYLPEVYVYPYGQEWRVGNQCNWNVKDMKLMDAPKRPLRNVSKIKLIRLMSKKIEEARREFMIRVNNKIKL